MGTKKAGRFSNQRENNNYILTQEEKRTLWDKIDSSYRVKRRDILYKFTSIAATLLLIGVAFYFFQSDDRKTLDLAIKEIAENARSAVGTDDEVSFVEMSQGKSDPSLIARAKSIYDTNSVFISSSDKNQAGYSSIYVPYGKRLEVELPDGTTVWLNAGSQLTYPNRFAPSERVVYLIGEGYFDVAHQKTPFKVLTTQNYVEVLGTTFNLSSYPEDELDVVELLTGSISFQSQAGSFEPVLLNPSEELEMNLNTNHIQIRKGSSGNSILWTKKQLVLDNTPLSHLFRRIERIYNVKISDESLSGLSSILYSGRLDMSADLQTVLNAIYELKFYDILIKEKEVTIKNKRKAE